VRLQVDSFALTSNNITYASFGDAMHYWDFFPAADRAWGCLPVWGFATVRESLAEDPATGRRVYGYFPAGTHLVVEPARDNCCCPARPARRRSAPRSTWRNAAAQAQRRRSSG
jgi:hypothetical protein